MKFCFLALYFVFAFNGILAQGPMERELFQAGVYGDFDRTVTCVSGQPGDTFQQVIWAWVPDDLGLVYITLRFEFPDNLDLTNRPEFNALITNVIIIEYTGDTVEWTMVFDECPSGWVQVFSQVCIMLDDNQSEIRILGEHSMIRDCNFILNDLSVLNNLSLNDPDCETVPTQVSTWGRIKSIYR